MPSFVRRNADIHDDGGEFMCVLIDVSSSPDAGLMAAILFLWQFPHFFSLSWLHRKDYARGGFKMIPCNDPTGARTADLVMR